jgi:hypothetical protein
MAIGVMPALEMAQESDKVSSWLKQEGEIVAKGEPLLEVEADKAVMEIESPGESILTGCVRKKNLCCGSVGRSVCASINSASRSSRHSDLSESAPSRGRAAEVLEMSQRRLAIRCSISTERCLGGLFRQDAASLVY